MNVLQFYKLLTGTVLKDNPYTLFEQAKQMAGKITQEAIEKNKLKSPGEPLDVPYSLIPEVQMLFDMSDSEYIDHELKMLQMNELWGGKSRAAFAEIYCNALAMLPQSEVPDLDKILDDITERILPLSAAQRDARKKDVLEFYDVHIYKVSRESEIPAYEDAEPVFASVSEHFDIRIPLPPDKCGF